MTAVILSSSPVSLEFKGPLKDGLTELAHKSGLNLVVIGDLDERVQLNFPSVDGEVALETIATAYGLQITRSGADQKMWVVRRVNAGVAVAPVAPVSPVTPVAPVVALVPPPPAAPPPPGIHEAVDNALSGVAATLRDEADAARQAADDARREAELLREKAESMRNVSETVRDQAKQALADARERAQEAAEEAREKAQEAAEAAREQAQEAAERAREQLYEQRQAEEERADAMRERSEAQRELERSVEEFNRHRVSTGGPVTVEHDTKVETAVAYGGPVIVEENAVVQGDAVAFGGDVVLKKNAVVDGDAVAFGGNVVREEGAVVHGETVSMGGSTFGATVAHNMAKTQRANRVADAEEEVEAAPGFGRGLALFLVQFSVFFGLGFVLMMFAPQRMKALEATIRSEPAKNGLTGFLGLLAAVPLTLLLVVTLVGIPVAILMWVALALVVPVGLAVVANAVGAKVPTGRMRKTQALVLAVGLLALLLIGEIPVLGKAALAAAVFVSLGAIIRTRFGQPLRGTPVLDAVETAPVI